MKRTLFVGLMVLISGALLTISAQERKLQRKDLPAAVQKTVDRESAGAEVKGFSTERENGIQTYEAEMTIGGHSKDISIDAKGNVLEVEEEVSMDSLPDSVRNALTAKAAGGTIGKIESLTKHGKLVAYEAVVTAGTKHREIQVGPNGETLKREQ